MGLIHPKMRETIERAKWEMIGTKPIVRPLDKV